ncbi:Mating-type switching protein swi10 [Penicillium taxi]|uniref:Mating-type switching protein swi10 n=1 Tax=Penicillium taxi TaxID=168475 RepID=UPI002545A93F|nr:Mating-type switching protein swi10 [Penicillium taxi]KAJ5907930.1 Mating-type switching protein swi10 [Penicillium taxi]
MDAQSGSSSSAKRPKVQQRRPQALADSRSASSSAQQPKVQQPKPQALPNRSATSAILVSTRQKGNPILSHIKLLPWEYADIPADYVIGTTTCALFLSLKYHRLHPEYIYSRLRLLAGKYQLRIVLVMVDIPNHEDPLKELSKTSLINNLTLILCWSAPEAAHYLELFKSSENAQPTAIRAQQSQSYKDSLVEFVTTPRTINKSNAASLISTFGTLQNAVNAQADVIGSVPGWGEKKVQQWCRAVREDFRVESTKKALAPEANVKSGAVKPAKRPRVAEMNEDEEVLRAVLAESRAMAAANQEPSMEPRPAKESGIADMDEDEEVLRAVMAESRAMAAANPEPLIESQPPDELSEGISAALAKLRDG